MVGSSSYQKILAQNLLTIKAFIVLIDCHGPPQHWPPQSRLEKSSSVNLDFFSGSQARKKIRICRTTFLEKWLTDKKDQTLTILPTNEKCSKCTIVKCTSHNIRLGKGSQFDAFCLLNVKVFVDSSIQPFPYFSRMIFDFARIQMNMYVFTSQQYTVAY